MHYFYQVLRFLFFVLIGGICAVLLFEAYLRVVEKTPAWKILPVAEVSVYGPEEQSSYTHREGVSGIWTTENRAKVSTTNFGIRANGSKDEKISKNDNVLKIGIVGDSIVEALQVDNDKTFSAILESKLNATDKKARVYNLGLAGATPVVKAFRAEKYAKLLNLDLVFILEDPHSITQTFSNNDGGKLPYYKIDANSDVFIDQSFQESRGFKVRQSIIGNFFYALMDHSRVATLLNARMNRGVFEELKQQLKTVQRDTKNLGINYYKCDQKSLGVLANINNVENQKVSKMLEFFVNQISKVQQKTESKFIFGFYNTWPDCPEELERLANKNLELFLKQKNIEFFNLKPFVQEDLSKDYNLNRLRGFGERVGIGHLNENGHEAFANAFLEYVEANNF